MIADHIEQNKPENGADHQAADVADVRTDTGKHGSDPVHDTGECGGQPGEHSPDHCAGNIQYGENRVDAEESAEQQTGKQKQSSPMPLRLRPIQNIF